jgi:AAA domain
MTDDLVDYDIFIDEPKPSPSNNAKLGAEPPPVDSFDAFDPVDEAEPRATNGHDRGAPPHTEIPESVDADREGEPPPSAFRFLSKREFISGFVAPDYLLDGILQRRFIYSLTAQTGHGKTALALLIARLVGGSDTKAALGKHAAEKGQVVYFAGENPDDLRMRVLGDTALYEDEEARIWFIPGTFSIEAMREKIETEIKRLGGVDLVIIDTSAAYFNGKDELSNTEMGAHARLLRTLTTLPGGPCVFVLCHPVKHVTDPSQLLPRGGGAFVAEVDGNLTLWKHDGVLLDLHHGDKLRGPGFEPISLRLETVTTTRLTDKKGRLMPTVRAVWISDAETERATEDARGDEDVLLRAMLMPGQSIAQLATACGWTTSKGEPHKSKVDRTMKRLAADKLVKKTRDTWMLTEAGKKSAENAASNGAYRDREARRYPT